MKAIKFMNTTVSKLAFSLVFAASLAACGGGDSAVPTVAVAATPTTVAISPTTATAATATLAAATTGYSFPTGVAALGTTAATTVTIAPVAAGATTPTFTIATAGKSAKGVLTYGSCIFTITESNIPELPVGTVKTVTPCAATVNTTNAAANDASAARDTTFVLGGTTSNPTKVTVVVKADGSVVVGGVTVGKATVVQTTGAAS